MIWKKRFWWWFCNPVNPYFLIDANGQIVGEVYKMYGEWKSYCWGIGTPPITKWVTREAAQFAVERGVRV